MPHIQKTGIYSWEVRRLGTLPGLGPTIGTGPTGPISAPNIAPGAAPPPVSSADVYAALSVAACDAYGDVGRNGPVSTAAHPIFPDGFASSRGLATVCSQIRVINEPSEARRWQAVYSLLEPLRDWEKYMIAGYFRYRGITVPADPKGTNSVNLLMADLLANWTPSSAVAPGTRPMVRFTPFAPVPLQSTSAPKLPGNFLSTQPRSSGGGSSTFVPPGADTTVHTSDPAPDPFTPPPPSTDIVNVTPMDTPPPGPGEPSPAGPSTGLGESWKPFAAVAIGAIVGVVVGRALT